MSTTLTIKEMDDINVLLTEVSLELLGNQFYDIFGQKRDTLRELYLPGIEKRPKYGSSDDCELLDQLRRKQQQSSSDSSSAPSCSGFASATTTSGADGTAAMSSGAESKDGKRRHTSLEKSLKKAAAAETNRTTKATRSGVPSQMEGSKRRQTVSARSDGLTEDQRLKALQEEIKNSVAEELRNKNNVSERLKVEHFLKQQSRMDTDYMDEYEIVQEFHAAEKAQLMTDSEALIQMVNFIKTDPKNAHKMAEISTNILNVKDHL